MKRFFTYEEYGAHWTTMSSELTTMCKGLHGWQDYERGVEALQKVIASENNRESGSKKALSFPDLLIKVRSTLRSPQCPLTLVPVANPEGVQISSFVR